MSWASFLPIVGVWLGLLSAAELMNRWRRRRGQRAMRLATEGRRALATEGTEITENRHSSVSSETSVAKHAAARPALVIDERYTVMARGRVRTGTLKSVFVEHCGTHFCFEDETPLGKRAFLVCEHQLQATARPIVRGHLAGFELITTAN